MASHESSFSEAVLIHGPKKSGTSLLHNLLDGGSELLVLPGELKIKHLCYLPQGKPDLAHRYLQMGRMDFPSIIQVNTQNGHKRYRANPDYCIEGLTKEQSDQVFDVDKYVRLLSEMTSLRLQDVASLIKQDVIAFAASQREGNTPYRKWAGKEVPGNSKDIVNGFRSFFPASRIVLLARDPKFIVRSRVLERRRKGRNMGFRKTWQYCAIAQETINFIFHQGIGKDIVVIYENLTQDIDSEMRRLARLLEIPFEPILCRPTALGQPVVVRTSSQKTTEVFRQAPDWRKDLTAAQVAAIQLFHRVEPLRNGGKNRKYVRYRELLAGYEEHEQS